jgi:uncharacterized coiled-coil protein SlyX
MSHIFNAASQTIVEEVKEELGRSQSEVIAELQSQLVLMTKEVNRYRKEMEPLQVANRRIPELQQRILKLEKELAEKNQPGTIQTVATVPSSPTNENISQNEKEIARLQNAITQQKAVESRLCQELAALKNTIGARELSCKKIISACCNVPLRNVDEILQPLLDALESEGSNLDLRIVSGFMSRVRQNSGNSEPIPIPDVPSEVSDSSPDFPF